MSGAAASAAMLVANAANRKRRDARILIRILRRSLFERRGKDIKSSRACLSPPHAAMADYLSVSVAGPREGADKRRAHRRRHRTVFAAHGSPEDLVASDVRDSVGLVEVQEKRRRRLGRRGVVHLVHGHTRLAP